jgi:D-alanine-D-alanine ligase
MGGKSVKIFVAYGGNSPEREVSLNSGKAVLEGLKEAGFTVIDGCVETPGELLERVRSENPDLVFIALHGGWGEDGRIQSALELMGIPYTGSGPQACFLAMDKTVSKMLFEKRGVPTPWAVEIGPDGAVEGNISLERLREIATAAGLVVKPCCSGSTVGVTILKSGDGLEDAIRVAASYSERVLAEAYIPGKELTVAVWGEGKSAFALPVIEIRPRLAFYTYEAKYTPGSSEYLCPAPLDADTAARVEAAAVGAHRALGCQVYSRVDLRLSPEGKPFVLEVNTAPGMTGTSLVPKAGRAAGWEFPELLARIARTSAGAVRDRSGK